MKKQIMIRALAAAPVGLMISVGISIGISIAIGDGVFYPVVPELTAQFGSELNAVMIQFIVTLLYGAMFGASSVIWEVESWGLLRQTLTHLGIVSVCTLPVAYFLQWMERSMGGILMYFGIFFAVYAIIWISVMISIRIKLMRINRKLQNS